MIAIVKNAFFDVFTDQCRALKAAFEKEGVQAEIYDNLTLDLMRDDEITFDKCVYLDKDIPLGLRLERLGVRLYNNIGAIELCDDKRRTQALLEGDIKMPQTVVFPLMFKATDRDLQSIADTVERLSYPLVAKEAFGSLGEQVSLLHDRKELEAYMNAHLTVPHLYQAFIRESSGVDVRVYTVGGKAVAAMERRNENDFRANLALGGTARPIGITDEIRELSQTATSLLGLDFGGVDLLYGKDGMILCEVNSNALFAGITKMCRIDIAGEIARYVINDRPAGVFPDLI